MARCQSHRRNSPLPSWPSRDASAAHPQDGGTALMLAAAEGHLEVVRYLANEKGADVNAKDKVAHPHLQRRRRIYTSMHALRWRRLCIGPRTGGSAKDLVRHVLCTGNPWVVSSSGSKSS